MSQEHDIPDQLRLSPAQRAKLVAYLDGELSAPENQEIEATLARSHTARREVEVLTRTWELLDLLPQPKAGQDLSSRTWKRIETEELRRQLLGEKWQQSGRRAALSLGWAASLVAAAAVGYLTLRLWPDESAALLEDLPVIEELDMYQEVGDLQFLEDLYRSGGFRDAQPASGETSS